MDPNERERLRLKAEVFKAMGHPLRLGIIEFLQQGEMCVCDIVAHVGTEISNVSKHLSLLKKAGLLADRRDGLKVMYSLTMPCAIDFAKCIEGVVINRIEEQRAVMVSEPSVDEGLNGCGGSCRSMSSSLSSNAQLER